MADFAPARAAQEFHFTDTKRRKVIVQHEFLEVFADKRVYFLLVRCGAQSRDDEGLRLSSGKQRRAVGPRQYFDFAGNRTDILQAPAVDAAFLLNNETAKGISF